MLCDNFKTIAKVKDIQTFGTGGAVTGTGGAGIGTGGAVCKGATPSVEQTGRSWVQALAAILARLGNKYLLKSLMMSTLHSVSVLDKPP